MAGHRLSSLDPRRRMTRRGSLRRVQLPAGHRAKRGVAARAHRTKPRQLLNERLATETDPIKRLEIALGYVKSAHRKYVPHARALVRAERALIRAGDEIFSGRRRGSVEIANLRRSRDTRRRRR